MAVTEPQSGWRDVNNSWLRLENRANQGRLLHQCDFPAPTLLFDGCLSGPVCLSHHRVLQWLHRAVCAVRFGLWLAACELLFRFYCWWTLSKSDSCVLKGKLESAFSLGNSCRIKLSDSSLMSQGFPSCKPAAKTEIIHDYSYASLRIPLLFPCDSECCRWPPFHQIQNSAHGHYFPSFAWSVKLFAWVIYYMLQVNEVF